MLLPADEALVRRDPALPGLALLLDDAALADWLGRRLARPVRVRGRYLRYKPANSCVLEAEVDDGTQPGSCLFFAYSGNCGVKVTKICERAPAGALLAAEPGRGVVATTPAGDRDLPALAMLDDAQRRHRLLGRLLPGVPGVDAACVRPLRHKPGRRWVGVVRPPGRPPAVLRCYRRGSLRAAAGAIGAWPPDGACTPRLLGTHPRRGAAMVEFIAGETLSHRDPAMAEAGFGEAGALLARMHGLRGVPLRRAGPNAEARALRSAARQVSVLLPALGPDLHALVPALAPRLAASHPEQPVHGDFSPDQVVVGDDGRAALIDLDSARMGDPALDLACAAAALTEEVALGRLCPDRAAEWLRALRAGYATVAPLPDPGRLAAHEAAHLVRRAVEPFRLRLAPDWPSVAADLVGRARRLMTAPTATGGTR